MDTPVSSGRALPRLRAFYLRGRYAFGKALVPILLVGAAATALYAFMRSRSPTSPWHPAVWWAWLEPLTGLVTLAVAVSVWWGEKSEEWRRNLPRKLTISFRGNVGRGEEELMRCERAPLMHDADVRNWAQSIGQQMSDLK